MKDESKIDTQRKADSGTIVKQIEELDPRGKAMPMGGLLTKEQSDVEVERGNSLDTKVWSSQYGLKCS